MKHFDLSTDRVVGESPSLRVVFDRSTGNLVELFNRSTRQQLIRDPAGQPWRALHQGTTSSVWPTPISPASGFRLEELHPSSLTIECNDELVSLRWSTSENRTNVKVDARFTEDGSLELWPSVEVGPDVLPPAHFTYPVIQPQPLEDPDRLLFPAHSGWLVDSPLETRSEGIYPDGYGGCSVQVMAYYTEGVGGFAIACHDPHVTHKNLLFCAEELSIRHDAWDLRRGRDLDLGYPVVITALERGDWYEAADAYATWAETAPWSSNGPNVERVGHSRPRWLYEDVGLSVWGGSSSLDWADRYRFLADAAGTPLHIVPGWDWPRTRPHSVGEEGWFPANFHPANLEAWDGHHVTPYLNDLFVSQQAEGFLKEWEPNLIYPYKFFPFMVFSERRPGFDDAKDSEGDPRVLTDVDFFVCPCTTRQREFHAWRDERLVGDHDLDGVFYDISSGNPFAARCLRTRHGHTPGWSRDVLRAYAENNQVSREAMRNAIGRTPAQGVETIVEHVIADVDFYVSRSVAGPLGGLEAMTLGPESQPGGGRELVPLFQAIYHHIGPIHQDGWVTLAEDIGDIFLWIAARLTLQWGGILSLHYANNPPERIPGHETADIISWDGGRHHFDQLSEPDESHIAFTRELARARTGDGRPYLAYGRILPPFDIAVPMIELDYFRQFPVMTGVTQHGSWRVPQVVHAVWQAPQGKIGAFFINLGMDPLDLVDEVQPRGWAIDQNSEFRVTGGGGLVSSADDDSLELSLSLPPREVVLVEIQPEHTRPTTGVEPT